MTQNQKQTYAKDVPGKDRLKLAATAMAANVKLHTTKKSEPLAADERVDEKLVKEILSLWPATPKASAETMVKFYGQPNDATVNRLTWYKNGPWKRTVVFKEEIPHDFPEPHVDCLEQTIDYHVPADKVGLIGELEGSLVVDRTKGEVSVHCDNEGANTLSLNMMHEVVTGKRTPQEARDFIKNEIVEYMMDRPAPYCEAFQFELPQGSQWDTDKAVVQDKLLEEAVGKVKKTLGLDK